MVEHQEYSMELLFYLEDMDMILLEFLGSFFLFNYQIIII